MVAKKFVKDLMISKVQTVDLNTTVKEACIRMSKFNIGAIVVTDDNNKPVGIFSERDLLNKVFVNDHSHESSVDEFMTKNLQYVEPSDSIEDVPSMMLNGNFRHLPVIENNSVVGMISMKDVLRHITLLFDSDLYE